MMRRWVPVLATFAMAGCADLDSGSWLISEQQEAELGAEYHTQLLAEMPAHAGDARVAQYVRDMGQRIVPHTNRPNLAYTFT
ncbi:MAG TPA: peptidase M48 Ste24p, partial [Myxococcota bacterium]|nr:peptidase M48 Ste24p [Myxococcota bacterium]